MIALLKGARMEFWAVLLGMLLFLAASVASAQTVEPPPISVADAVEVSWLVLGCWAVVFGIKLLARAVVGWNNDPA